MSLVSSDHITPGRKWAAHYKMIPDSQGVLKPGMIFKYGDPKVTDKMCPNCYWVPFSNETVICHRCGRELE